MTVILVGLAGASLIILAWILGSIKAVQRHKSLIDLQFAVISLIGSFFLTAYSYLRNDIVFLGLSVVISLVIAFEILYSIHVKKIHKKRKR